MNKRNNNNNNNNNSNNNNKYNNNINRMRLENVLVVCDWYGLFLQSGEFSV